MELEFEDEAYLRGNHLELTATRHYICGLCPGPSNRAVTVCQLNGSEPYQSIGCRQPICILHVGVSHEIARAPGLSQTSIDLLKRSMKPFKRFLSSKSACCQDCEKILRLRMAEERRAKSIREVARVSSSSSQSQPSAFRQASPSSSRKFLKGDLNSVRKGSSTGLPSTSACRFLDISTPKSNPTFNNWFIFRGVLKCTELEPGHFTCGCIRPYSGAQPVCEQDYQCDRDTEHLDSYYCSSSAPYKRQIGPGRCPYYMFYWKEHDLCVTDRCPALYMRMINGYCEPCFPFEAGVKQCVIQNPWDTQTKQFNNFQGYDGWCEHDENGEQIPIWDALGQVQCLNTTLLSKYDRSLPPEQRLCQPDEIYLKVMLGCHHECPMYQAFSFIHRKCESRSCHFHQTKLKNGMCHNCGRFLGDPCPEFEV